MKHKLKYIYFSQEKKFYGDFTCVYFPITELISDLYQSRNSNKPLILGFQAHQGCGKTTMTSAIALMLNNFYDINSVNISIDDFYKTFEELNDLKKQKPEFKYRGPPGTHDLSLAYEIFKKINENENNYSIPRYNKALRNGKGDRNDVGFEIKFPVEVLLFEGWFLGALPKNINCESEKNFCIKGEKNNKKANNNNNSRDFDFIENSSIEENSNLKFNKDENKSNNYNEKDSNSLLSQSNKNLKEYENLWNQIDFFVSLKPEHFSLSKKWRIQAEKKMKGGMDYRTIKDFCDYFWKSVPPDIYLDKLEEFEKPLIKIIIDNERNFYI
jgi:D-glycerate 3-kinase